MAFILETHVEVHVFRRRKRKIEFLCLRRSQSRRMLPGVWQPVTGKREWGERAAAAALRELKEETGLVPRRFWVLESATLYFDVGRDRIRFLPLFAAEVGPRDPVRLSSEHDAYRFLGARAAGASYLWEAQRRAIEAVRHEVLARPRLASALEITAGRGGRGSSRRRAPRTRGG